MRQVTSQVCKAFVRGEAKKLANTATNGTTLFLHGNAIAWKEKGGYCLTLSGWNSVTTRERLNGLARIIRADVGFYQKNHCAMVRYKEGGEWKDMEISPRDVVTILADGGVIV